MNVVDFPAPVRLDFAREFDNLRFEIQCARSAADRLRLQGSESSLAHSVDRETLENTLIHLGSLISFLSEVKDKMEGIDEAHNEIPAHILKSWTQF